MEWIDPITKIGSLVFSIFAMAFAGWTARNKRNDQRLKDVEKDVRDTQTEVAQVKEVVAQLPTAKDMHEMQITITETRGAVREIKTMIRSQSENMTRLEKGLGTVTQYLMESPK